MKYSSAEEVLGALVQAYYENRDIETTLACVTDDIEWIGTDDYDSASGKNALRLLLERDLATYPFSFDIEVEKQTVQVISKDALLFTVFGKQKNIPDMQNGLTVRGTICCINTGQGWLANNIHTSIPNTEKEMQQLEQNRSLLLMNMLNTIPGGIGIFIFGETLGCEYYSDGFARMAGITRAEMDRKLEDNTIFSSLIAPVDFPRVVHALAENTAKGLPLNLTYRYIYGDGSVRWLHLSAEKMGERNGLPAYYCVFTTPTEDTALYRSMTEESANGIAVFKLDTREVLYMNIAAVKFYGLNEFADISEKSIVDILNDHSLEMMLSKADISKLNTDDYTVFHVERENKYLAVKGKIMDWGSIPAYILYIADETAEYEKELKLKKLFDQIPTGISALSVGADGINQTLMNSGYYKIYGISADDYADYAGYNAIKSVLPEDRQIIFENLERLSGGENECDFVYRSGIPGHENTWVRLVGSVFERDGDNFTLYGGFTDVTQQVLAQKRQQELFDTIPSGVLEFFFDGLHAKVISANQTLLDMIGYETKDFSNIGEWNLSEIVHPEDYHLLHEAQNSVDIGKGKTYDFRLLNKKTGVYRWISCDFTITERSSAGVKVVSAFLDIEEKRKLEDASRAKSAFLSRMSHEIRTPINAVLGMAELGRQDVINGNTSPEVLLNYFDETTAASKYLLTLVNDVLDTSRIENNKLELHPTIVNAQEFLQNITTLVKPLAESKSIKLITERKTHHSEDFIGDQVRVKQILINIINNAIKFTPAGGEIYFSSEATEVTEKTTMLKFTVKDNGIGMTEKFQKTLFAPFTQENNGMTSPFEGTGLGLSIAKALAEQMGGSITCQSKKGVGTTFAVTIRVENVIGTQKPKAERKKFEISVENVDLSEVRILLCEDHPLNQKIAKSLLERRKCIVDVAGDGLEGLRMFRESPVNHYSLVLMDIRMPLMDGLEATKEIRSLERPDAVTVPVVAMSANAYEEDIRKSLEAGMNAHLAKPVDPSLLYSTIASFTNRTMNIASPAKKTILVVDDIEMTIAMLKKVLNSEYEVLSALNGKEALNILKNNDEIALVITDVVMPEMDGEELIKTIRQNHSLDHIAIIANTQYGEPKQEEALLSMGADDFIYKPLTPKIVATRVRYVLARYQHFYMYRNTDH